KPDLIFLWDEAWFAFASFHPTYRRRTGMGAAARLRERFRDHEFHRRHAEFKEQFGNPDDDRHWLDTRLVPDPERARVRVYVTHSTHKTLTALRQGSMIHVYDQDFKQKVEEAFHEAYMTHTSTSPNYQILASLDVGRRQVELEGYELVQKQVDHAMALRERIATHAQLGRLPDRNPGQDRAGAQRAQRRHESAGDAAASAQGRIVDQAAPGAAGLQSLSPVLPLRHRCDDARGRHAQGLLHVVQRSA